MSHIAGPYHCEKVCMSLRLYRLLLAFGFVLVSRPDAAFRQRAATAQLRTRHRSISRTRSIWYSRRGCAKKSGRRLIGSRCAAFSRRGTTRIMRCDHDYGYEWLLLARHAHSALFLLPPTFVVGHRCRLYSHRLAIRSGMLPGSGDLRSPLTSGCSDSHLRV